MLLHLHYLGEILSFTCAILWATAVVLFRKSGETVSPLGLNLFKNVLGLALFLPTSLLLGEALVVRAPLNDYLLFQPVVASELDWRIAFSSFSFVSAFFCDGIRSPIKASGRS